MTQTGYLIIAIVILLALLATFIISFVIYRRTPVPKGCENLEINEENCAGCKHSECSFYKEHKEEEEKK